MLVLYVSGNIFFNICRFIDFIGNNLEKKICGIIISGINWIIWNLLFVYVDKNVFNVSVVKESIYVISNVSYMELVMYKFKI